MKLRFHTLDVFTATRFGGNPLAVVLDADGLSPAQMQTITREFNLSETTFVMAPETAANTAKVRIFFPGGDPGDPRYARHARGHADPDRDGNPDGDGDPDRNRGGQQGSRGRRDRRGRRSG